jgi:hypothetical protein
MIPNEDRTLRIGEKDYIGFRFQGDDMPSGVTVASGTVAVSPATGLTLGSGTAVLSGTDGVYAWVTAVTAGTYEVKFTVLFSDTKSLIRVYRVRVE